MSDHIMSRPLDPRAAERWDCTFGPRVRPQYVPPDATAQEEASKPTFCVAGDIVEVRYRDPEERWVRHVVLKARLKRCPTCEHPMEGQSLVIQQLGGDKLVLTQDFGPDVRVVARRRQ